MHSWLILKNGQMWVIFQYEPRELHPRPAPGKPPIGGTGNIYPRVGDRGDWKHGARIFETSRAAPEAPHAAEPASWLLRGRAAAIPVVEGTPANLVHRCPDAPRGSPLLCRVAQGRRVARRLASS